MNTDLANSLNGNGGMIMFRIAIVILLSLLNYIGFTVMNRQTEMMLTVQRSVDQTSSNQHSIDANVKDIQDTRMAILAIDRRVQRIEDITPLLAIPKR